MLNINNQHKHTVLAGLTAAKKMIALRWKLPHSLSVKRWILTFLDVIFLELSPARDLLTVFLWFWNAVMSLCWWNNGLDQNVVYHSISTIHTKQGQDCIGNKGNLKLPTFLITTSMRCNAADKLIFIICLCEWGSGFCRPGLTQCSALGWPHLKCPPISLFPL